MARCKVSQLTLINPLACPSSEVQTFLRVHFLVFGVNLVFHKQNADVKMSKSILFPKGYDEAWFQGEVNEEREKLNILVWRVTLFPLAWCTVNLQSLKSLSFPFSSSTPPSQPPLAFTGCLPCVPLSCALPCLISCPFVTKAHSKCANSQLCLPRFCQSRQIKHVRWHVEEKVLWFIMELFTNKSYFSWPDTCSLRLDHISRHYSRLFKYSASQDVCVLMSVCLHIRMQLENWSWDVDYKRRVKGKSCLLTALISSNFKLHHGYLSWGKDVGCN